MGMTKCVNEAHHHNTILSVSHEHRGDHVMQEIMSLGQYRGHCSVRESQVLLGIQHGTYDHVLQCGISELRHNPWQIAQDANSEPKTGKPIQVRIQTQ